MAIRCNEVKMIVKIPNRDQKPSKRLTRGICYEIVPLYDFAFNSNVRMLCAYTLRIETVFFFKSLFLIRW
jgi:hypothetical protein